jgi:mono/diheme cytochrome c family protein
MSTTNYSGSFEGMPASRRRLTGFSVGLRIAAIAVALTTLGSSEARKPHSTKQSNISPSGDAQKGRLIFEMEGCNKCHGAQGEGMSLAGKNGGGVPRIASTSLALPIFVQLVRKPRGQMPPFGNQQVSDHDLANIYAFLLSVKLPSEQEASTEANPQNGKLLFTRYGCYECHGYLGQGSMQTGGSRLGPPQIPLSAFISYVREPTGQMPPYGSKVVSNKDLADIYSFLQSIPKPSAPEAIPLLNQ